MSPDPREPVPAYMNMTPVCLIVNELNRRCAEIARAGDMENAVRMSKLAEGIDLALSVTSYYSNPDEHSPK